jgi:hypothetical protein
LRRHQMRMTVYDGQVQSSQPDQRWEIAELSANHVVQGASAVILTGRGTREPPHT